MNENEREDDVNTEKEMKVFRLQVKRRLLNETNYKHLKSLSKEIMQTELECLYDELLERYTVCFKAISKSEFGSNIDVDKLLYLQ